MKKIYAVIACIFFPDILLAQAFLNGSFEKNTATDCLYNLSNASYNSTMSHVSIGVRETMDIFYDLKCESFGLAKDGHFYTTLENPVDIYMPTVISMELSEPVILGKTYSFSYYDRIGAMAGVPIELGVSADNSTFGTVIYTSPTPTETTWTKRTVNFTAPLAGKYITGRYKDIFDSYVMIDQFEFDKSSSLKGTEKETGIAVFPNPASDKLNITLPSQAAQPVSLKIFNQMGQMIIQAAFANQINITTLQPGVYLLEIRSDQQSYFRSFSKY